MIRELKRNITIEIPETHVLIEKVEFERLEELSDVTWVKGLDWLKEQKGIRTTTTLRKNILYKYRDQLEDSCVSYPEHKGENWYFNVAPMKKWLRNNFS